VQRRCADRDAQRLTRVMRSVRIALAAGLTLLALAIGLTLLQSPTSVAGTSGSLNALVPIASTSRSATYCQAHELLPQGTSAIRLLFSAVAGPRLGIAVSSRGHPITSGVRGSGWSGEAVTISVKQLHRAVREATVCVSFRLHDETVTVGGNATPPTIAAHEGRQALTGRMGIEYLRPGGSSWASMVLSIARRMGLGRAAAGTWNVLLVLALLAAVAVLASNLVLKELG